MCVVERLYKSNSFTIIDLTNINIRLGKFEGLINGMKLSYIYIYMDEKLCVEPEIRDDV